MEPLARNIMRSRVITVTPETPLSELARTFVEDGISGVPVVQVDGKLVGVVSRTDLLERLVSGSVTPGMGPYFTELFAASESETPDEPMSEMEAESEREQLGTVDDIMESDVVTVAPTTPASIIAAKMARGRVHRVVVVDRQRVVGIVTSLDMMGHWQMPAAPVVTKKPKAAVVTARARPKPRAKKARKAAAGRR
ncbi:MAG: CBS domain-containing protein [Planctomycetes bacterium]|nr:CBS domain-containing protein [Planctomycetota bacterium]MBI3847080.1 CBS domain-containing protein [Planctomycetota bacterium]